jgi:hypothetical protein
MGGVLNYHTTETGPLAKASPSAPSKAQTAVLPFFSQNPAQKTGHSSLISYDE